MELIIYVLMLFIVLSCAFKLSLWRRWQRLVYSLLLGGFAYWSIDEAAGQSKTQMADYLQNSAALETMAIVVTLESVCGLVFALAWLQGRRPRLLYWYPSLLMFPVVFYALTQTLFMAVGVPFSTTALCFAVGIVAGLPLLAEGVRWLLPDETGRVELYLLLVLLVCVLGLLSTENGKMVYSIKEAPVDWGTLALTFGGFVLLAGAGFALSRLKWRLKKKIRS